VENKVMSKISYREYLIAKLYATLVAAHPSVEGGTLAARAIALADTLIDKASKISRVHAA
jgi:hypothetical protein